MVTVGLVESLWRYPVKSMAGESVQEAFVGFAGVYGDRFCAVVNADAPKGFPYLTGRERRQMLLYQPHFRDAEIARRPPNQAEAESLGPGLSPLYPPAASLAVEIKTPAGQLLSVDDPKLLGALAGEGTPEVALSVVRSDRAITDCRPVSLISVQTILQIGHEVQEALDKRRFRANIYAHFDGADGFAEDGFVGRRLKIGPRAVIAVIERDARCKMIGIDPVTADENPNIPRNVARAHGGNAGVYGAVLVEGMVKPGDPIVLLD
jgi:uncharacterized protein